DCRLCFRLEPATLHRKVQCLPSTRLLHQPDRRGRSAVLLSSGLDTTGSGETLAGPSEDGPSLCPSAGVSRNDANAGSRTVERRRAASEDVSANPYVSGPAMALRPASSASGWGSIRGSACASTSCASAGSILACG